MHRMTHALAVAALSAMLMSSTQTVTAWAVDAPIADPTEPNENIITGETGSNPNLNFTTDGSGGDGNENMIVLAQNDALIFLDCDRGLFNTDIAHN